MALVHAARVKETSTTTGTGTYSLAGAPTGFQTFVAGIGDNNICYYTAENGTDWEEGIGTVDDASPDTLARTLILSSSNANAAVNWGAGTKTLFCSPTPKHWPYGNTIAPAQITSDQNNYAPTGNATASVWELSTDANRTITGIAGGFAGRYLLLVNAGSFAITISDADAGSDAANQFKTIDFAWTRIEVRGAVLLRHDGTAWQVLTDRPTRATQSVMESATGFNYVTAGDAHSAPSAAKFWVKATGNSTTMVASYNMTSWANTGTGDADGTIATDFSSVNWCGIVTVTKATNGWDAEECTGAGLNAQAAGTFGVLCSTITDGGTAATVLVHPDSWHVLGFGDQ